MLSPKTSRAWLLSELIALLDTGTSTSIESVKTAIHNRVLDAWLMEVSKGDIDLSALDSDDWNDLHNELQRMLGIDERRRMGIEHNGICLLARYLVEDLVRIEREQRRHNRE
jgi:hypothetical protein